MEWIDVPAKGLTLRDIRRITRRDQAESEDIRKAVEEILANVEQDGDAAVRMYTEKFDGVAIEDFLVTPEEIDQAVAAVGPDFMSILEEGAANVRAYHERQVEKTWFDTFRPGVRLGAKFTPIQRVGVYVPG
ncbi:histidinol dehydrogenase, partial [Megasphaera sp.]